MLVPGGRWLGPGLSVFLASILCSWSVTGTAADGAGGCTPVARVVSITGSAQLQRTGQAAASSAKLGTLLCKNDLLHTDVGSRAALFISAETLVRLDQNSTVRISQTDLETVVEFTQDPGQTRVLLAPDQCGAGYFITRYPKRFRVITPFTNAVVEGTEFLVALRCESTEVAVFEGRVRAEQTLAASQAVSIASGESFTVGEREPPVIKALVKPADAVQWVLYYPPLSETAAQPDQACESGSAAEKSRCLTARAEQRLRAGRVDEAQRDIDAATRLLPNNADADALSSVISVVKNDKARALELAQRATQLEPLNARAWIALSYAQQASFKLEDALASAERSAELAPRSSTAQARVAELLMSLGKIRSAERAAQAAVDADPNESRAHTILGFVHLAQIDTKKAREDFNAAIERDSSDPLPRLGLGLAIIRDGKLKEGREEIEIAVALDPTNSLIRSYVGKAYYEENTKERDKLAATQFGLAKQLDAKDPTPWFYNAILNQTQNRPVEALEDLQKSIELNDNRLVYRSKLLLDEDRAARMVSLSQAYRELGFTQPALLETAKAIASDPGNVSAHRSLADLYSALPRHDFARQSELLQTQLRQPVSIQPLSPDLTTADPFARGILRDTGPTSPGLYEFNPLFARNGLRLQMNGISDGHATWGDQVSVSGLVDRFAFSLSQLAYDTNGFRDNNDLSKSLWNAYLQYDFSPQTSIQVEARTFDTIHGDPVLRFDPAAFFQDRGEIRGNYARLGVRQSLASDSELLASFIYIDADNHAELPGVLSVAEIFRTRSGEVQLSKRFDPVDLLAGIGYYSQSKNTEIPQVLSSSDLIGARNAYLYLFAGKPPSVLQIQAGLSYDYVDPEFGVTTKHQEQVNPKLGIIVNPTSATTLRAAYFQVLKRRFLANQTLEPTEVGGFAQFFDDPDGTDSTTYAAGVDHRLSYLTRIGVEAANRDLTVPQGGTMDLWHEILGRVYFNWAPTPRLALNAAYEYEKLDRAPSSQGADLFAQCISQIVPLTATVFLPAGLSAQLRVSRVFQHGSFAFKDAGFALEDASDRFWVADASVGYLLPRRMGFINLEIRNLFKTNFMFQETDTVHPLFARDRLVLLRLSLTFP